MDRNHTNLQFTILNLLTSITNVQILQFSIFFEGLDVCSSLEQLDSYENISLPLATKDKQYIEETTGCLYPCTWLEYKVSF